MQPHLDIIRLSPMLNALVAPKTVAKPPALDTSATPNPPLPSISFISKLVLRGSELQLPTFALRGFGLQPLRNPFFSCRAF